MEWHSKWSLKQMLLLCTYLHIFSHSFRTALGGEKLALLSATLRTYQKVACDTDQILVTCPRGTSISIEFAQYNNFIAKDGISIEQLCLAENVSTSDKAHLHLRTKAKHLLRGSVFALPAQKMSEPVATPSTPSASTPPIITTAITNPNITTVKYAYNDNENSILINSEAPIEKNNNSNNNNNKINLEIPEHKTENCMWPNALQYSLLQTVVEACQKKKHCRFSGSAPYYSLGSSGVGDTSGTSSYHTSTTNNLTFSSNTNNFSRTYNYMASNRSTNGSNYITGSGRPCPKQRKIVEIAYKCRPYEFRSKVACHNDVAQLECNPYSRIAVYSASFGRTEYESIQCPQPQGVREETCLASYATETVMQICHGRRRCNLAADANTFGTPCRPNSRMYLKVVYTCVPKQVLKERYESDVESDEPDGDHSEINELYDDDLNYKESKAIPKLYSNTTATIPTAKSNSSEANISLVFDSDTNAGAGDNNPVMTHSADLSIEDNRERLYLYVLICGSASVIIIIVVIATRLVLQKRDILTTNTNSSTSIKMTKSIAGVSGSAGAGGVSVGLRCGITISERDANIEQAATNNPMSVASLITNKNFATYSPKSNSNLNTNNICDITTPNTIQAFQGGVAGPILAANTVNPALMSNPLVYGHRTSPDIIGISSSAFVSALSAAATSCNNSFTSVQAQSTIDDKQIALDGILAPAIVIGSGNAVVDTIGVSCDGRVMGTLPLSALTQYTTAPTFQASYIINADSILTTPPICISQQPTKTSPVETPTTTSKAAVVIANYLDDETGLMQTSKETTNVFSSPLLQQQKHQGILKSQMPVVYSNNQINAAMQSATLRRNKVTFEQQQLQQHNISYDGTAPRTLSTGVPINSQFYYG